MNILRDYFYEHRTGPGIWKWDHYFDIYTKHFDRFRFTDVRIVEIGVYSGGSLDMWSTYFGLKSQIIGVDIQPECMSYERKGVKIYIGNQSKKEFWEEFKSKVGMVDIVIDDGSHKPRHQALTFNQLFPHIRPGGMYLCEDIHGYPDNQFADYMSEYARGLNDHQKYEKSLDDDRRLTKKTTTIQREIKSVSFYPYVVVVEKNSEPVDEFIAPRRGTEWQPFRP